MGVQVPPAAPIIWNSYMSTKSNLKQALENKRFVITAETSPPDAADAESVIRRAGCLKNIVDAVNVTDGAGAKPHMSALATAAILAKVVSSLFFNLLQEIETELPFREI